MAHPRLRIPPLRIPDVSRGSPVPQRDRAKFAEHMNAVESADQWVLLDAAEEFMIRARYLRGDPLSAVEQWRRLRETPTPE